MSIYGRLRKATNAYTYNHGIKDGSLSGFLECPYLFRAIFAIVLLIGMVRAGIIDFPSVRNLPNNLWAFLYEKGGQS